MPLAFNYLECFGWNIAGSTRFWLHSVSTGAILSRSETPEKEAARSELSKRLSVTQQLIKFGKAAKRLRPDSDAANNRTALYFTLPYATEISSTCERTPLNINE